MSDADSLSLCETVTVGLSLRSDTQPFPSHPVPGPILVPSRPVPFHHPAAPPLPSLCWIDIAAASPWRGELSLRTVPTRE